MMNNTVEVILGEITSLYMFGFKAHYLDVHVTY